MISRTFPSASEPGGVGARDQATAHPALPGERDRALALALVHDPEITSGASVSISAPASRAAIAAGNACDMVEILPGTRDSGPICDASHIQGEERV